jgi:hypothetical protein
VKPVRIVAKDGGDVLRRMSREDLRRSYRLLRTDVGLTAWQARSLITDIVMSGAVKAARR